METIQARSQWREGGARGAFAPPPPPHRPQRSTFCTQGPTFRVQSVLKVKDAYIDKFKSRGFVYTLHNIYHVGSRVCLHSLIQGGCMHITGHAWPKKRCRPWNYCTSISITKFSNLIGFLKNLYSTNLRPNSLSDSLLLDARLLP